MSNTNKAVLTEGPIVKTLVKLTIPMLFSSLSMVVFNLIDTYFVGQLGTNELAAMSFTFPVVLIGGSIAMGLGVGTSAVVSRAIGEGNQNKVKRLTTDGLVLGLLIVLVFVVIGLLTIEPVFRLLGATADVMPFIKEYMTIWYLGLGFVVIPMVGNNAIRATGDTLSPSMIMLVAMVVNLILDPIFIFGFGPIPKMALGGAALATVFARATTLLVSLYILYYREKMITFVLPTIRVLLQSWKEILFIGLPAAGTNIIIPLSTGIITSLVATYGAEAVAGLGVATRIEAFAMIVYSAMSSVIGPFVGQNWGARRYERVKSGVKYSYRIGIGWGIVIFLILLLAANPIASLFNDDADVIHTIVTYLRIVPISYGLSGIFMLSSIAFNVLNKPLNATALTILKMGIIYIPMAYIGSHLFGIIGIFGAAGIANIISGIFAYIWLDRGVLQDFMTQGYQREIEVESV